MDHASADASADDDAGRDGGPDNDGRDGAVGDPGGGATLVEAPRLGLESECQRLLSSDEATLDVSVSDLGSIASFEVEVWAVAGCGKEPETGLLEGYPTTEAAARSTTLALADLKPNTWYKVRVTSVAAPTRLSASTEGWLLTGAPLPRFGASAYHTCQIRENGALYCWGLNSYGQLGDGTTTDRNQPSPVDAEGPWKSVSLGVAHTCGVKEDGSLHCWGWNGHGRLGDGTTTDKNRPVRVGTEADWHSVSLGGATSCGLKNDGTLYCWGNNEYGQLGDGTTENQSRPRQVGDESDWRFVAAGLFFHVCGIKRDGTLHCWGAKLFSGDDPFTTDSLLPRQVGASDDWRSIAVGDRHACGVRSRLLYCWGNNDLGQLGDGTTAESPVPKRVSTEGPWESVAAGVATTCGIKMDGTLYCWGLNNSGQVGDGTEIDRLEPTPIGSSWQRIDTGISHTCGLKGNNLLYCWGNNSSGQLGIGTDGDIRTSPVPVAP